MRITIDISEDVLLAVKAIGRRERKSAGQVISELARKGLGMSAGQSAPLSEDEFLVFRPLPSRGFVVTSELIERLREDEFA